MATTRLQDDLLLEFKEEKKMIQSQISIIEPLAVSMRKPAAQRLAAKGMIIFGEIFCWLSFLAAIATCFFLNRLYPFYVLFELYRPEHVGLLGHQNVQFLQWSFYGLFGLSAILFYFLARSLARIRQKNGILNLAGRDIKTVVGQHLQRKAAIDAIEQRHFNELPSTEFHDHVNLAPNPGYDPAEHPGLTQ